MSATTNTTAFVFAAAREAYSTLRRQKGLRAQSVIAFLTATDNDERDAVIEEWGSDYIRRGLREAAIVFDRKDEPETANAFWLLRDSIDLGRGGFLDFGEGDDDDNDDVQDTVVHTHHGDVEVHDNDDLTVTVHAHA